MSGAVPDLSASAGPVRDQGARPTCIAFATSDVHASHRSEPYEALSAEYLFYHARRRESAFTPSVGATLAQTLEALKEDGQPLEESWPYLTVLPADMADYAPPPVGGPTYQRTGTKLAPTYAALESELRANRTVLLVFRASEAFVRTQSGQSVDVNVSDSEIGLHAVVVVALESDGGRRRLKIKNSWGTDWADAGYAWMTEQYFNQRVVALVGMN